jgi:P-type Mg2+ transporter
VVWAPERIPDQDPAKPRPSIVLQARSGLANYASASPLEILRRLEATRRGLTEDEAQARLALLGDNSIALGRQPSWGARIRSAVCNPFIVVLACLALVSAATGDLDGAAVIAAMALVSCVLRIRQERRSDRAAAALRAIVASTATVLRRAADGYPGIEREIPIDQIVPGDIVQLAAGDLVPADLRLLRTNDLAVSQAVITGESLPAAKRASSVVTEDHSRVDQDATVFESPVLCFMGTNVTSGSGTAVVVATGGSAYLSSAHGQSSDRGAETAFDRGARSVSWLLVCVMGACVPVVLAVNATIRGQWLQAFLFAVAVAVGLTPEMLPVVVTTALARGARVLADRAAIVKRLPALHNLGAMEVLCTDKTGTLTEDRVAVACTVDPVGRHDPQVLRLACVNSYWSVESAGPATTDAIDLALLAYAADRGVTDCDRDVLVGLIPFDVTRRRGTVVVRGPGRLAAPTLITKGSAEDVLGCCTRIRVDGSDALLSTRERASVLARLEQYATDGVRVLGVAVATRNPRSGGYGPADEAGLTLIGFVGFRDPPRSSARAALAGLAGLGSPSR